MFAYLDCRSGVSGDKFLGALVDAGLDPEVLAAQLGGLAVSGAFRCEHVYRAGKPGVRVVVEEEPDPPNRSMADIARLLLASSLEPEVRDTAARTFKLLAEAEADAHGVRVEEVHFHEVGALDSIVDVVGTAIGMRELGITEVSASPVRVGRGTVLSAHGLLHVPAPATARLLADVPTYAGEIGGEMTTPTGAALLRTFVTRYEEECPDMEESASGKGAGSMDPQDLPNLLGIRIGRRKDPAPETPAEETVADEPLAGEPPADVVPDEQDETPADLSLPVPRKERPSWVPPAISAGPAPVEPVAEAEAEVISAPPAPPTASVAPPEEPVSEPAAERPAESPPAEPPAEKKHGFSAFDLVRPRKRAPVEAASAGPETPAAEAPATPEPVTAPVAPATLTPPPTAAAPITPPVPAAATPLTPPAPVAAAPLTPPPAAATPLTPPAPVGASPAEAALAAILGKMDSAKERAAELTAPAPAAPEAVPPQPVVEAPQAPRPAPESVIAEPVEELIASPGTAAAHTPVLLPESVAGTEIETPTGHFTMPSFARQPRREEETLDIETVVVLETVVDHVSPEDLAMAIERQYEQGALDCWQMPVFMKKGRLGSAVTVLARPADAERLAKQLMTDTGTLGVRRKEMKRYTADRQVEQFESSLGDVRVKVAEAAGVELKPRPEADDVGAVAERTGLAIADVAARLAAEAATAGFPRPTDAPAPSAAAPVSITPAQTPFVAPAEPPAGAPAPAPAPVAQPIPAQIPAAAVPPVPPADAKPATAVVRPVMRQRPAVPAIPPPAEAAQEPEPVPPAAPEVPESPSPDVGSSEAHAKSPGSLDAFRAALADVVPKPAPAPETPPAAESAPAEAPSAITSPQVQLPAPEPPSEPEKPGPRADSLISRIVRPRKTEPAPESATSDETPPAPSLFDTGSAEDHPTE